VPNRAHYLCSRPTPAPTFSTLGHTAAMGPDNDELAHVQYWDERYKNDDGEELETYDWFRTWEQVEAWFRRQLYVTFLLSASLQCYFTAVSTKLYRFEQPI